MYFDFKNKIKDAIVEQYKTISAFCELEEVKEKGYNIQVMSLLLNPSKNVHLSRLYEICEIVGLKIDVRYAPKLPERKHH